MRIMLTVILLAASQMAGAEPCSPPPGSLEKLGAYLRYLNGTGSNKPSGEPFLVATTGDRVFFRARDSQIPSEDPTTRTVYIYAPGRPIDAISCPADATWTGCVAYWVFTPPEVGDRVMYGNEKPHYGVRQEPVCELTLLIAFWKPSPNDARKKKVAAEVLGEIERFAYPDPKVVYVRDFNLEDPEISAYIVPRKGEPDVLGCHFDVSRAPHCGWHRFGQSPLSELRRTIMRRPYRLYPPPMGRP